LNYKFAPRREGDVEIMLANVDKAAKKLNWRAEKTLEEMCKDSFKFITNNPDGIK
jgi:UDP-glucose 4-epimerase